VAACTTPDDGDIVVREEGLEGTVVCVLHTVPRADQHLLRSREEAVSKALAFAKRRHVCAWFANGDDRFVLLGTFQKEKN